MSDKATKTHTSVGEYLDVTEIGAKDDAAQAAAMIDDALGVLITVRQPGRGKLSLREALDTAEQQQKAYEQWCRRGTVSGVIDVWLDNVRVMTAQAGEAVILDGLLFRITTMKDAIVQVVRRADEIADTVVLLNRQIPSITSKALEFTEIHPGGQRVTLRIEPKNCMLSMWVGLGSSEMIASPTIPQLLTAKAKSAWAGCQCQIQRLMKPRAIPAFGACLLIMLCAATIRLQPFRSAPLDDREVEGGRSEDYSILRLFCEASQSFFARAAPNRAGYGIKRDGVNHNQDETQRALQNRSNAIQLDPVNLEIRDTVSQPLTVETSTLASLSGLPETGKETTAEVLPWEARRAQRLSEVRSIYLQVDDSSQLDADQKRALLGAVSRALENSGLTVVESLMEKQPSDGTMLVHFEPDATCFGAIFATMQDRAGKILWQEHAGCRALPNGGHVAMLEDASARLIDKLPLGSKLTAQSVAKAEDLSIDPQ